MDFTVMVDVDAAESVDPDLLDRLTAALPTDASSHAEGRQVDVTLTVHSRSRTTDGRVLVAEARRVAVETVDDALKAAGLAWNITKVTVSPTR